MPGRQASGPRRALTVLRTGGRMTPGRRTIVQGPASTSAETFTDLVFLDGSGRLHTKKVSSSVDDYARAIIDGLGEVFRDTGISGRTSPRVLHGTTVASNAVLRARGAPDGADHHARDSAMSSDPPPPDAAALRPHVGEAGAARRALTSQEVTERIDAHGASRRRSTAEVEQASNGSSGEGIEALAVCLINSYANPAHEEQIKALVKPSAPRPGGLLQRRGAPEIRGTSAPRPR